MIENGTKEIFKASTRLDINEKNFTSMNQKKLGKYALIVRRLLNGSNQSQKIRPNNEWTVTYKSQKQQKAMKLQTHINKVKRQLQSQKHGNQDKYNAVTLENQ